MPDETGAITAGRPNIPAATTPVNPEQPDLEATPPIVPGAAPDIGSRTASSVTTPPRPHPTFFRQLLFSLGKGLVEGTKAGLQAPQTAQGPAIAATTAIQAPQKEREQLTSNQLNDLNVAMTQLKLHQLHMIVGQMDEDRQNAVYNRGRDTLTEFIDKGKAEVMATGDLKSVQDEFQKRQADARQANKGLLPLQIMPSPGSDAGDPKYALVMLGKDRLTEDMDETWSAKDLGLDDKEFKEAGLTPFKFHASAGMDQQKALQLKTTQYLNWLTKAQNQLGEMARTKAGITSREKIARDANDVRRAAIAANNIYRSAKQELDRLKLDQSADKTVVAALGKLVQASKNVGDKQTITAAAWEAMSDKERANVSTNEQALAKAQAEYNRVSGKSAGGSSGFQRKKFPPNTPITKPIADNYKKLAGGNTALAKQMAAEDNLVWPNQQQQPPR